MTRNDFALINALYASEMNKSRGGKPLLDEAKWRKILTKEEISSLNKAYTKFSLAEPMLVLESNSRSSRQDLWEQFLFEEDKSAEDKSSADQKNKGEKKSGFLGKAWEKVKKGTKAVLGAGGLTKKKSMSSMFNKADRAAEYEELVSGPASEVIKILNDETFQKSKEYPNMKSNEEFQKLTLDAFGKVDQYIQSQKDEALKAVLLKSVRKWVSWVLDEKLGDYFKHFEESAARLEDLIVEAEENKDEKTGDKPAEKKDRKYKLSSEKGESETLKGLKSNIAPAVAAALGTAGAVLAGAIFSSKPELGEPESIETITQGDPKEVEELVDKTFGDIKITDWTAQGSVEQAAQQMFGKKLETSQDFVDFFKTIDPSGGGDASAGARAFYKAADIADQNGKTLNTDYVLDRLSKMDPKKAFNMPGVGPMERMGGRAGIPKLIKNFAVKTLTKKKIVNAIKTVVTAGGAVTSLGAGAATAVGVGLAAAATGLLSAIGLKLLRNKSLKKSRAAWLDALDVGIKQEEEKKATEGGEGSNAPPPQAVDVDPGTGKVTIDPNKINKPEGGGGGDDKQPPGPDGKPTEPGGDEDEEDAEDEEMEGPKCTPEELKKKLDDAAKNTKYNDEAKVRIVGRVLKALQGATAESVDELTKLIKSKNPKMKDATAAMFAKAVEDCFVDMEDEEEGGGDEGTKPGEPPAPEEKPGEEEPEKKVEKLGSAEIKDITNDVWEDYRDYKGSVYAKTSAYDKMSSLTRDDISKLVNLLNDKGKLQHGGDYNELDREKQKGEFLQLDDKDADADFKKRVPPGYKGIFKTWRRSEPDMMDDVESLLSNNDLPLYLLANRRALREALKLIYKHAGILNEKKRRSGAVLIERWQKLAGVV